MRPRGSAVQLEERRKKAIALVEKEGLSQAEAARQLHVSVRAVRLWFQWHRGRGKKPRSIEARPAPGRPRRLSDAQERKLRKLLVTGAQAAGFANDLWTCRRVRELIRKECGVSYHLNHLPKLLRRLGFSPQRPIRRAVERDERAIQRWRTREWPLIKKKPRK